MPIGFGSRSRNNNKEEENNVGKLYAKRVEKDVRRPQNKKPPQGLLQYWYCLPLSGNGKGHRLSYQTDCSYLGQPVNNWVASEKLFIFSMPQSINYWLLPS